MGHQRNEDARDFAVIALTFGLLANLLSAVPALMLFTLPPGSRGRPMGQMCFILVGATLGLGGVIFGLMALVRPGARWLGFAGLILGLAPFPLGMAILRYLESSGHLIFLP
jgi:hypothetical protein